MSEPPVIRSGRPVKTPRFGPGFAPTQVARSPGTDKVPWGLPERDRCPGCLMLAALKGLLIGELIGLALIITVVVGVVKFGWFG